MHLNIRGWMDEGRIVGASFAVIRNGQVVDAGADGFARADVGVRATPFTVFEAALLGKPIFAYIVLKLVEQGLLSLAQPLAPADVDGDLDVGRFAITARHILSHT